MKKWLIIVPVFLIVVLWQATELYLGAMEYQNKAEQKAVEYAKKNASVNSINKVEYYHGNLAYHVIYGISDEEQEIIVWVPELEDGKMIIKNVSDGWSKEKVRNYVLENQEPKKIIDIRLGAETMKDNRTEKIAITPIWEVTYIDHQDRYTYYFLKFIDGSFVKRYSLKQK